MRGKLFVRSFLAVACLSLILTCQFTLSRITHYIGYTGTWHFRQNFLSTAIFIKIAKYSLLPTWTDSPHSTSINTQVQGTPTTRHGLSWSKIFLKIAWLVSCQHSPNFTLFPPAHSKLNTIFPHTPNTGPPSPLTNLTWLTSRCSTQVGLRMCGNKLARPTSYCIGLHWTCKIIIYALSRTNFAISCYHLCVYIVFTFQNIFRRNPKRIRPCHICLDSTIPQLKKSLQWKRKIWEAAVFSCFALYVLLLRCRMSTAQHSHNIGPSGLHALSKN